MDLIFIIIFAYLLGSIPFGKLIGLKYGVDIQKKGSGNIGATNALRLLGWKPGVLVLVLDVIKGFIPVKLALEFLPLNQVLIVGLITILAHIFPIWLKFKGGKGVATGLGILFAIDPMMAVISLVVFSIVFLTTKIVSISSIIATSSLPFVSYLMSTELIMFSIGLVIIVVWAHRENIVRIIKGTEKRIIS